MRLSIITINLNNREGLRKTAASVVNQTFSDYEWIIVDGASTDGSVDVANEYAKKIGDKVHVTLISEPDTGIYNAMNKGILKAKGEYCFFLNSGDYLIEESSLQKAFDLNFTEDVVYGFLKFDRGDHFEIGSSPKEITLRTFVEGTIHHTGNVFIRRELFNEAKYGLYDETLKIVSDWKWFLQALGLGTATARYIDVMISVFDCTGISETQTTLMSQEREYVLANLLPERILKDYLSIFCIEDRMYQQELEIRSSRTYRIGFTILKPFKLIQRWINH